MRSATAGGGAVVLFVCLDEARILSQTSASCVGESRGMMTTSRVDDTRRVMFFGGLQIAKEGHLCHNRRTHHTVASRACGSSVYM